MAGLVHEPMLEMFIFETTQLVGQLEQLILESEQEDCFSRSAIDEIFRIMHTIKGSSAMMLVNEVSSLAHAVEDVFYFLREFPDVKLECASLSDLILSTVDFIKSELEQIKSGNQPVGSAEMLLQQLKAFLTHLKETNKIVGAKPHKEKKQQYYVPQSKAQAQPAARSFKASVFFEEGCEMENIRAFTIIHNLKAFAEEIYHFPEDIIEDDSSAEIIRDSGFHIACTTNCEYSEMQAFFQDTIFLKNFDLQEISDISEFKSSQTRKIEIILEDTPDTSVLTKKEDRVQEEKSSTQQSIISVSVTKLDKLMDLVGELVISEAMVTQNPDLQGLALNNFSKAARQLRKITGELQDTVMSIRMVPLSNTFQKMHRVVRDMSKKLNKEIKLELLGEETEVDKNIIENISDPLMHIIRNAIDHGVETSQDRLAAGKMAYGKVLLEARNVGSEVLVIVKDDGRGLDKTKILEKAKRNNLVYKPENELTDQEIYAFILSPGFSTKDQVTEFSGRGVGMDVVAKNINSIGGTLQINSTPGQGTTITLKIPLTLAIIDGMTIGVGSARYTIPTISIKQSFRAAPQSVFQDVDGNEMILIRGKCYPILRLHKYFGVKTEVQEISEGILVVVENENRSVVLFADALIGEQQVVVKSLPNYFKIFPKVDGLAGCTLLGDGSISLILDVVGLMRFGYSA
ncbi:chemotaxis protein CheA [Dendrosporobacter sp. 1207_IL3150]|uniref:chemotaxis protein CheA n=1 Tax=Dendrosporobacter sp. 1207_IL3150 TaxID=3084054 RepID=UPI002FD95997